MRNPLRNGLVLLPLLTLSLSGLCGRVTAQNAPPVPSGVTLPKSPVTPLETRLTIVPGEGVEVTGAGSARCSAGEINPAQTPRVERVFTLKNDTRQPVTIGQTRGSCGCETILLVKDGTPQPRVTLQPDEQVQLRVAVRTANLHSGESRKMAWVYAPGNVKPLATVEIALTVRAFAMFTPALLDFGKMSGGLETTRTLTAQIDASLVGLGALPPLVSSNPDVSAVAEGSAQTAQHNGRAWIEQKYRVTVRSQARGGTLTGTLRFAAPGGGMGSKAAGSEITSSGAGVGAGGALTTVSVPLMGDVAGGLVFTPKSVYLGSLPSGKGATRQVAVSGAASKLQNLTLTASSPWVTAAWTGGNTSGTVHVLEVTLKPQTPSGALQAQIILTGPGGEKLILPVIAEVIAGH